MEPVSCIVVRKCTQLGIALCKAARRALRRICTALTSNGTHRRVAASIAATPARDSAFSPAADALPLRETLYEVTVTVEDFNLAIWLPAPVSCSVW